MLKMTYFLLRGAKLNILVLSFFPFMHSTFSREKVEPKPPPRLLGDPRDSISLDKTKTRFELFTLLFNVSAMHHRLPMEGTTGSDKVLSNAPFRQWVPTCGVKGRKLAHLAF